MIQIFPILPLNRMKAIVSSILPIIISLKENINYVPLSRVQIVASILLLVFILMLTFQLFNHLSVTRSFFIVFFQIMREIMKVINKFYAKIHYNGWFSISSQTAAVLDILPSIWMRRQLENWALNSTRSILYFIQII